MLNKVESEAADGATLVSELLAARFSRHFPLGRPGRLLDNNQRLKGSARKSYLKCQWTPRTGRMTRLGEYECLMWLTPI